MNAVFRLRAGVLVGLLLMGLSSKAQAQSPDPYLHFGGVLIHLSVMSKANLEPTGWSEQEIQNGAEQCRKACAALQYPDANRSFAMLRPLLDSTFFKPGTQEWAEGSGHAAAFTKLRERVKQINGPITIMRVRSEEGTDGLRRVRFYIKGPDMKCPPAEVTPSITPEGGRPWSCVVAIQPNGKMKVETVLGDLSK